MVSEFYCWSIYIYIYHIRAEAIKQKQHTGSRRDNVSSCGKGSEPNKTRGSHKMSSVPPNVGLRRMNTTYTDVQGRRVYNTPEPSKWTRSNFFSEERILCFESYLHGNTTTLWWWWCVLRSHIVGFLFRLLFMYIYNNWTNT